jgi:hypothetical protein
MCFDSEFIERAFIQPARVDGPQAGRSRMMMPAPAGITGTGIANPESDLIARMDERHVFMMGDNPDLPKMPERPKLIDFFKYRLQGITVRHLLTSASKALEEGQSEPIILACLLHDISNGCLIRSDHGYWGAQMIAPYVSEEVAWAVQYHQCLRYFADESVGYAYPESYNRFFGADYRPPDYIRRDAEMARNHRWYGAARAVTLYDIYFFDDNGPPLDPEIFTDLIARHFRDPEEGLGFDYSPVAHMWRTAIWPNNLL